MSDALISQNGKLGTVRNAGEPQTVSLFYGNEDLEVPYNNSALPEICPRFALGAFQRSFENIFFK